MTKRNKIILAIVAVILLICLIFLVYYYLNNRQPDIIATESADFVNSVSVVGPPIDSNEPLAVKEKPQLQSTLKAVAVTFAERFGSYSSESNFTNFDDLSSLMTEKMKLWSQNFIIQQSVNNSGSYYGIDAKAVSTKINTYDQQAGQANVVVVVQRREYKGNTTNPRIFYQNLILNLVQKDNNWLIDQATWEEK